MSTSKSRRNKKVPSFLCELLRVFSSPQSLELFGHLLRAALRARRG